MTLQVAKLTTVCEKAFIDKEEAEFILESFLKEC